MSAPSSPRLLALHGLRLKGTAEPAAVAAAVGADADLLRAELDDLADADLVSYRYGRLSGYQLTPEGKAVGQRLLDEELASTGTRPAIEAAYRDFRAVNNRLLEVCTAWQLREVDGVPQPNDHTDAAHDDAVRAQLEALHQDVEPVLDALTGELARFGGHQRRLRFASEQVRAGEHDYLTRPMFPSYHSVWFELHEDLLATLGMERDAERRYADEGR